MVALRVPIAALLLWALTAAACGSATTDAEPAPVAEPDAPVADEVTSDDVSGALEDTTEPPEADAADTSEAPPEVLAPEEVGPPPSYCGDGVLDPGEVCDDGEDNGTYGHCTADCAGLGPHCGDGVVDGWDGELCDDGVNDALDGGCLPGCDAEDLSDLVFEEDLLSIAITLPPEQWEALRHERKTRHGMFGSADCRNQQIENPYTWYSGTVTVNGTTIENTGLRKKGHIGSQSTLKPSLKVKFHEFVPGQHYKTLKRFALNNAKSDKGYAKMCLAYSVFAAAGIPAPRCTHAHVTVNGVDMGPYVVVEEYKKPFMRRHFPDITGNLYEGTACDWRPEFFGGFEQETNLEEDPSKADLQMVMDVMAFAADDILEASLGAVFDMDRLYRYWAVESLVWHRDGYSGNANNYMLYADPSAGGRFVFLPWGPDAAMRVDNRANVPDSVLAFGAVTYRLYQTEAGRARFYEELLLLLDTVWDPEGLTAEVEAVRALLGPLVSADQLTVFNNDLNAVKSMVTNRRAVIEEVLAPGFPEWTTGMRTLPCMVPVASISGTFETTWGSLSANIWDSGSGTLSLTLDDEPLVFTNSGARIGWKSAYAAHAHFHLDTDDERRVKITFKLPDTRYFDDFLVLGVQELIRPPMNSNVVVQDLSGAVPNTTYDIGEGTWTFTAVGDQAGDAVSVAFEGTLYQSVN